MSLSERDAILNQAMRLPPDDRAALAHALFDSVHDRVDPGIEEMWLSEIRRRIDAYDRGETKAIPADEVRRRAAQRVDGLKDAG